MLAKNQLLPVMEAFYTVQGEGHFSGKAAYFIRLGGCDVGCVWCDVKESWDAAKHPLTSVSEMVTTAATFSSNILVITGGEPFMYDLSELTQAIQKLGKRAHVETAGVYPLSGQWDWICFSPKKFKKPLPEYYLHSHELKVVIYHESDLAWAETHAAMIHSEALLYLQPEWEKRDQMMPLIVEYVKSNPKWQISLQTHKYLQIP